MLGSYGPQDEPYIKNFESDESPSGLLARSGSYQVESRVIDDDGEIYKGLCHKDSLLKYLLNDPRLEMVFQACQRMVGVAAVL